MKGFWPDGSRTPKLRERSNTSPNHQKTRSTPIHSLCSFKGNIGAPHWYPFRRGVCKTLQGNATLSQNDNSLVMKWNNGTRNFPDSADCCSPPPVHAPRVRTGLKTNSVHRTRTRVQLNSVQDRRTRSAEQLSVARAQGPGPWAQARIGETNASPCPVLQLCRGLL